MAYTLPVAVALGVALLGFGHMARDPVPEPPVRNHSVPDVHLISFRDRQTPLCEAPAEPLPLLRAASPVSRTGEWATGSGFGSAARASVAPLRPQARPFHAQGHLVARAADPNFGPEARPLDLLVPDPPARLAGASDLLCIAVAIYHEARDQPLDGQLAVASVILNRTQEPERWGATPCEVVVPVQFSFLAEDGSYPAIPKDEAWSIALEMAREALERGPSPLVGQADHYHTPAVDPAWNESMDYVVRIADHIFFVDPLTKS